MRHAEVAEGYTGPGLTVSVGGAFVSVGAGATPEAMLSCADASLYQAKGAGRNRVGRLIDVALEGPCQVTSSSTTD